MNPLSWLRLWSLIVRGWNHLHERWPWLRRNRNRMAVVIGIAIGIALPFLDPSLARVCAMTYLYMMLALGLNVVPGFTGLLDLGYVGFYGIGAYTAGILTVHYNWPLWLLVPTAAIHGAIWGILLGAPTLRLTGDYFAIVTFGFSELVYLALINEQWLTRGPNGITDIARPDLFGLPLTQGWQHAWLILAVLLVVIVVVRNCDRSRLGRAWSAIREDPIAAEACGIDLVRYKILAFAVSAAIAGVGGALFARMESFISPDSFKFWESILILCLVVLGGMGSIRGVLLGTAILYPLTVFLREAMADLGSWGRDNGYDWLGNLGASHWLVLGVIMIVMMRFRPAGLLPRSGVQVSAGHGTRRFSRYTAATAGANDPDDHNRIAAEEDPR